MIGFVHLRVQKSNTLTGINQLLLSNFAASLCLFQSSSKFLNFSNHETVPAIHHSSLFLEVLLGSNSIIKVQLCILVKQYQRNIHLNAKMYLHCLCTNSVLQYLELCLHIPQLLLGLRSLAVGVAQLNLHLIQVSLHLLLDSQGIVPAPDLRIQSALHGVNHPLAVPLDLLHLLVFLCQLPVHLTLNLVEFQLNTQDLRLFMFQSSLIILKNGIFISVFKPFIVYLSLVFIFFNLNRNVPQPLQVLSGSQTSLSPPASWTSPAHGCSCQSHQSVQ